MTYVAETAAKICCALADVFSPKGLGLSGGMICTARRLIRRKRTLHAVAKHGFIVVLLLAGNGFAGTADPVHATASHQRSPAEIDPSTEDGEIVVVFAADRKNCSQRIAQLAKMTHGKIVTHVPSSPAEGPAPISIADPHLYLIRYQTRSLKELNRIANRISAEPDVQSASPYRVYNRSIGQPHGIFD